MKTKESTRIFGLTQKLGNNLSFIVIILIREVQLTCSEKNHFLFTRFILVNETSSEKFYDAGGGLDKSQNIWGKIKFNFLILQERRNSVLYHNFTQELVPMKRSQEQALHLTFFEGESKPMLSRLVAQRIFETTILQVNLKIQGVEETLKWEFEKKEVWTLNVVLISELRGIESYVWFRRLWRSVSQRRMPRETEKHKQKIFHPRQCWFQMQRRQRKRDERRS